VFRLEGKGLLARPRCRCMIILYLKETEWYGVDWTYMAQDGGTWQAFVNMTMNIWVT
jgi:hypothetical protein